jgi:hypothetical protein
MFLEKHHYVFSEYQEVFQKNRWACESAGIGRGTQVLADPVSGA